MPEFSPRPPAAPVVARLRTCLSGIGKAHQFRSVRPGHRICDRCRPLLAARTRGLSPRLTGPVTYHGA